jgi:hypothetical protein
MTLTPRYPEPFGVTTLYKFRPFSSAKQKGHVREILIDHKMWFSRANQLNDPEDLRPRLIFHRGADDNATRALLRADAEVAWARSVPPLSSENLARRRFRLATAPIAELEREGMERAHARLDSEYWILSLASSRDSTRMWDEYADGRRGVCIHFSVAAGSPFRFAQRVIYQRDAPVLRVPFGDTPDAVVADLSTRTKTLKWQHEAEFRWVRYPDLDFSDTGFYFEGRYAHFPAAAITGVTVGTEMPEPDVQEILRMAAAHKPRLSVYRPRGVIVTV